WVWQHLVPLLLQNRENVQVQRSMLHCSGREAIELVNNNENTSGGLCDAAADGGGARALQRAGRLQPIPRAIASACRSLLIQPAWLTRVASGPRHLVPSPACVGGPGRGHT